MISLDKKNLVNKLSEIDIGVFYCNTNFSIKGSYPTKFGEFLSSGIPIMCNIFNEEITNLVIRNKIGIISNYGVRNSLFVGFFDEPDSVRIVGVAAKFWELKIRLYFFQQIIYLDLIKWL